MIRRQTASAVCFMVFLNLLFSLAYPAIAKQKTATADQSPSITVQLIVPKKTFKLGESVPVTVYITNVGKTPVLIQNLLSTSHNSPSHIVFSLTDSNRRRSPSLELIGDRFSPRVEVSPAAALLRSWLLLWPKCSFTSEIRLDSELFTFLGKTGKYELSGTYFSSGLQYPSAYREIGLTEQDIQSLPFQSWTGHISTNAVNFQMVK